MSLQVECNEGLETLLRKILKVQKSWHVRTYPRGRRYSFYYCTRFSTTPRFLPTLRGYWDVWTWLFRRDPVTSQSYSSSASLSLISWGTKMISGKTQSCSISQLSPPSLAGHHGPYLIRLSAGCGQQHPLSFSCLSGDGLVASLPKPTLFQQGDCERPPHTQHGAELSGFVNSQRISRWLDGGRWGP